MRTLELMHFYCEAYGPSSDSISEECFMAGGDALFECTSQRMCALRMRAERQRVWQAIQRLAATDSMWAEIGEAIRHPEQLLGGALSSPDESLGQ